jgi:hypothetical protein
LHAPPASPSLFLCNCNAGSAAGGSLSPFQHLNSVTHLVLVAV